VEELKMKKIEAEKTFKDFYVNEDFKKLDKYAQRLEWTMYTDNLCKGGEITNKQFASWDYPRFIK
jgi:hypothetical protein